MLKVLESDKYKEMRKNGFQNFNQNRMQPQAAVSMIDKMSQWQERAPKCSCTREAILYLCQKEDCPSHQRQRAYCQNCCQEGNNHQHFPLVLCYDVLAKENAWWSKVHERMQTMHTQAAQRYNRLQNVIGYLEAGIQNKKISTDYKELSDVRNEMFQFQTQVDQHVQAGKVLELIDSKDIIEVFKARLDNIGYLSNLSETTVFEVYKNVLTGIDAIHPLQNFTNEDRDIYTQLKMKALNEKMNKGLSDVRAEMAKGIQVQLIKPFLESEQKQYIDKLVSESGEMQTAIFTSQIRDLQSQIEVLKQQNFNSQEQNKAQAIIQQQVQIPPKIAPSPLNLPQNPDFMLLTSQLKELNQKHHQVVEFNATIFKEFDDRINQITSVQQQQPKQQMMANPVINKGGMSLSEMEQAINGKLEPLRARLDNIEADSLLLKTQIDSMSQDFSSLQARRPEPPQLSFGAMQSQQRVEPEFHQQRSSLLMQSQISFESVFEPKQITVQMEDRLLKRSNIIKDFNHLKMLQTQIRGLRVGATPLFCLYKGISDGLTSKDFHKSVDGHGPLLFLMRSVISGQQFGAYTSKPWSSSNQFVEDPDALIFSVFNQKVFKVQKPVQAVFHSKTEGPHFGNEHLAITKQPFTAENAGECKQSKNIRDVYCIPSTAETNGVSVITGEKNEQFTIDEIEVYLVRL
ncbi:hypothetical protein FGO68_gene14872 [Halteria grandinella]|uniref:TLDc domain-containing protein n=1 Tax=Halteria grandinella TaxID=5974 RepID=A0A8J8NU40_HALGN|nr:hypothetical protein FGO68_gene14872 [Halteria grandinella]